MVKELIYSDLPLAAEVIRTSFATVAKEFNLTEQNCPKHTSFIRPEKLQKYFNQGLLMYGFYEDERLIGYVSLSKKEDRVFELHSLAILPEYRHKGYGKQLLDFCKVKVKELCGDKITIGIIEENIVLKDWYTANSFVHTGTKKFDHLPFTVGYMMWEIIPNKDYV